MSAEGPSGELRQAGTLRLLVDGHVHLHPRFDEARFFGAAHANFARAAEALKVPAPWEGVLVLTEIAGTDRFSWLREEAGGTVVGRWTVEETSEDTSVRLRSEREQAVMTVVAGRQVQTREGLEVLAFPHRGPIREGQPIHDVILRSADADALCALPWGFGKWAGRRGRIVQALLSRVTERPFLLADTGHRPAWASRPSLLRQWEELGRPILMGSDPLPLEGEEVRPGSCCFQLSVPADTDRPALQLKKAISTLEQSPPRYEERVGAIRFATSQVSMQIRKRRR